jgi:hypothetical protein
MGGTGPVERDGTGWTAFRHEGQFLALPVRLHPLTAS